MTPTPSGYGRNVLLQTGIPIDVSADGRPEMGFFGSTIDWNLVSALSSPYTDQSGVWVPTGSKMLRFGQVITTASGNVSTSVVNLINSPTGGTFTLTAVTGKVEQTTAALAFNASTSAIATALAGLSNVGTTVTGSAGANYTIALPTPMANATFSASGASLTGGSSPAATASGNVVTITGSPTGGTFTITVTNGTNSQTTSAIAYNASTATVLAAIQALSNVGTTSVSGTPGSTYTVALPAGLGNAGILANGTSLTGAGLPPNAYVAPTPTEPGMVGPYDPNATDGRATLALGSCGILNSTVVQGGLLGFTTFNTTQVGLIVGGAVYIDRVIQAGAGSASLAAGPTLAALEAALPRLYPVKL